MAELAQQQKVRREAERTGTGSIMRLLDCSSMAGVRRMASMLVGRMLNMPTGCIFCSTRVARIALDIAGNVLLEKIGKSGE